MKNLLITGGTGEIGDAIVNKFQQQGYNVIAPTRQEVNLLDNEKIQHFIKLLSIPLNAFIHCAGFNEPKSFSNIEWDDFNKTFEINCNAFYKITHEINRKNLFQDNSNILGISSIYGAIARKGRFSYVASKHALVGMVKSLALELAEQGIKVNSISPGFVATKMTYKNNSPEKIKELMKKVPLAKLAEPKDIANIAYFLCSEDNAFITGQDIIADGGYIIGGFEE